MRLKLHIICVLVIVSYAVLGLSAISKYIWIEGKVVSFGVKTVKVQTLMGPINIPRSQFLKSTKLSRGLEVRVKTSINDIEKANAIIL